MRFDPLAYLPVIWLSQPTKWSCCFSPFFLKWRRETITIPSLKLTSRSWKYAQIQKESFPNTIFFRGELAVSFRELNVGEPWWTIKLRRFGEWNWHKASANKSMLDVCFVEFRTFQNATSQRGFSSFIFTNRNVQAKILYIYYVETVRVRPVLRPEKNFKRTPSPTETHIFPSSIFTPHETCHLINFNSKNKGANFGKDT